MSDRQKAFEALKKSLRDLSAPHFYLLNNATVTFKKDETIKASVQRRADRLHFIWSNALWDSFTNHERIFETLHLCQHLMSGHFTRLKPKLQNPETKEIAGQAIDLAANHTILRKFGFKDSDLPTIRKTGAFVDTIAPDLALSDDLSAEEYYFALNRQRQQQKKEQEQDQAEQDDQGDDGDDGEDQDGESKDKESSRKSKGKGKKGKKDDDSDDDKGGSGDDGSSTGSDSNEEDGDDADSSDADEEGRDSDDSGDESDESDDGDVDGERDADGEDDSDDERDDSADEGDDGEESDDNVSDGDEPDEGDDGDGDDEPSEDEGDDDEGEADESGSLDNHDLSLDGEHDISDLLSEALQELANDEAEDAGEEEDGDFGFSDQEDTPQGDLQKATQLMEQAFGMAAGTLAGNGIAGAMPPPKIVEDFNPAREWRKFAYKLEKSVRTDKGRTSWTPNKKYSGLHQMNRSGMFLPSYNAPSKSQIRVIVFLDTSGSCVWMASTFMTILASMPKEIFQITAFTFTNYVRPFDVNNPTYKSGGTSFKELERYFDEEVRKDTASGKNFQHYAFVLTDGEGTTFAPKIPSQWFFFMYNIRDMWQYEGKERPEEPVLDIGDHAALSARARRGRFPSTTRFLTKGIHVYPLEPFLPPAVLTTLQGGGLDYGGKEVINVATQYSREQARINGTEHKDIRCTGSDWDEDRERALKEVQGEVDAWIAKRYGAKV